MKILEKQRMTKMIEHEWTMKIGRQRFTTIAQTGFDNKVLINI